uniref:DUF362 domain-containing protein n=1 Tax=Schistosoma mansoni TaxID=6183 RepID=A0A5K4F906_SCHMA
MYDICLFDNTTPEPNAAAIEAAFIAAAATASTVTDEPRLDPIGIGRFGNFRDDARLAANIGLTRPEELTKDFDE